MIVNFIYNLNARSPCCPGPWKWGVSKTQTSKTQTSDPKNSDPLGVSKTQTLKTQTTWVSRKLRP